MSYNLHDSTTGIVNLVNGRVDITGQFISSDSVIIYCVKQASGNQGFLSIINQVNGSFSLISTDPNDQSSIFVQLWG